MQFIKDVKYLVSFETGEGSKVSSIEVRDGYKLTEPKKPTREKHKFVQWFKDKELKKPFDFKKDTITENITLYAKWERVNEQNTITLVKDDGMEVSELSIRVTEQKEFELPVPTFDNGKVEFLGWALEDGTPLTDASGKSLKAWDLLTDVSVIAMTNQIKYEKLDDDTYRAVGSEFLSNDTEITIPAKYNDAQVTEIGTFKNFKQLKKLNIPATVKNVEANIFEEVETIAEINVIPVEGVANPVYSSEKDVLYKNEGKTLSIYPLAKDDTEFEVPSKVTEIEDYAFADFVELNKKDYTYYAKGKLSKIVLPKNLTRVGKFAFTHRGNLKTVEFKEGGTQDLVFDTGAFNTVPIKDLKLPKNLVKIGDRAFEKNAECTNFNMNIDELVIPDSVKEIGNKAFYYNSYTDYDDGYKKYGIKKVRLGSGLEIVGAEAFQACGALTYVEFAETGKLTTISNSMFSNTGLTSITLPKYVTTIGSNAFERTKIEELVLGDNITTLRNFAFSNMGSLASITIPKNVTSFGLNLFKDGDSLEFKDIHILNTTVASKDENAIYNSDKTTILYVNPNITEFTMPETVVDIPVAVFAEYGKLEKIVLSKNLSRIPTGAFEESAIKTIVIPASVTQIDENAFYSCRGLTSITFEDGSKLTSIGKCSFMNTGLSSIELPEGLKSIGEDCFTFSGKIKNIVIPDSVTQIGDMCFREMVEKANGWGDPIGGLESVKLPKSLEKIGSKLFSGSSYLKNISIDGEAKNFKVVENALYDKDNKKLFNYVGTQEVKQYTVLDGTTTIGNNAFVGVKTLDKIILPVSVKTLEDSAFYNCSVSELDISNITSFGESAFANTGITSVKFNKDIHKLPRQSFFGCKQLVSVDLTNITYIAEQVFANCSKLVDITYGANTVYENDVFSRIGIKELVIPQTITKITKNMYNGNRLTSLTIGDHVTEIHSGAFYSACYGVKDIKLGANITKVETNAFGGNGFVNIVIDSQAALNALKDAQIVNVNKYGKEPEKKTKVRSIKVKDGLLVNKEIKTFLDELYIVSDNKVKEGYVEYVFKAPAPTPEE